MNRTIRTVLAVICIGLITFCAVLLTRKGLGRARIDLTEHKLYTLSQGTKNILGKLNQPVTLKLYYSRRAAMKAPEQIRHYNNYYLYVRSVLEEFAEVSDGKLALEVIDPRPFTEAEEAALDYGLRRFQLPGDESFFFGLVTETELGKNKVIEFFEPDRQEFVEYDVAKLIVSLMQRERERIGVLSSLPVLGMDMSPYMMQMMRMQGREPEPPWTIVTHLRERYELERVAEDAEEIPKDLDFLMIIHPKKLSPQTLFAIDQFVMKGGRLMVFLDPYCANDRPKRDPRNPWAAMQHDASSELNELLAGWGVEMSTQEIAVDRQLAEKVPTAPNQPPQLMLPFLGLKEENLNDEEVITADLEQVRVFYAGVLVPRDLPDVTVVPLMTTSKKAGIWRPASPMELRNPNPEAIWRAVLEQEEAEAGEEEPLVLGYRITGKLKTNFPGGPPPRPVRPEEPGPPGQPGPPGGFGGPGGPGDGPKTGEKETPKNGEAPAEKDVGKPEEPAEKAAEAEEPAEKEPAEGEEAPEQAPPTAAEEAEPEPVEIRKESPPDAMVLVFSDVDMISDAFAYRRTMFGLAQAGDNATLVLNAVDFLSGSGDLIAIRSRGEFERPFDVVEEIEREAEKATADEMQEVNRQIREAEQRLRELGQPATEEDEKLVRTAVLEERARLQAELREARKRLRKLEATKREDIEELKSAMRTYSMFLAPAIVLLIAIVLAVVRYIKAKSWVARSRAAEIEAERQA